MFLLRRRYFPHVMGLGMAALCSVALSETKRETFDFGWKFARFGNMPDGTVLQEPGKVTGMAAASSEEPGNTADLAIDGDPDTRWCASDGSPGQTLTVDMGATTEMASVKILWEKEANHLFSLDASSDGKEWIMLAETKQGKNITKADVVDFSGRHRYLRLTVTDTGGNNWASVRELEVYDSEGKIVRPVSPSANEFSIPPSSPDFDDKQWRPQDLPHDWGVEGPFRMDLPNETGKLPWDGIGWYRKNFNVPVTSRDHRFCLDFDGVMSRPRVYVNGELAGEWKYGYASFRIDITPYLKWGEENLVAVRVDNPPHSSRWYPGGGIYRHVWICESNPVHIAHWGVFVKTPEIKEGSATIEIDTVVENNTEQKINAQVTHEVMDPSGKVVATAHDGAQEIAPGGSEKISLSTIVDQPLLWDIDSPQLYTLKTIVKSEGKTTDIKKTPFGIRTIEWRSAEGFFLNGRRVQLNGVCQHHDLGPLGSAVYKRGYERQVRILKEMGVNSIRTSHNPPAPELLDICDREGILVIDELFDMWQMPKKGRDYHNYFPEWHERDLVNFCHRDRNHPCIILWSTGNEVSEQGNKNLFSVSQRLTDLFHREDPTRLVTAGCNNQGAAHNGFADTFDVYGYNYKPHAYAEFHEKRPDQPVYGSETSSCVSTRGTYFFPSKEDFWNKSKGFYHFQVSSYDLYAPGWAYRPDIEFKAQDANKHIAGEYVWTGFDYLGEPTPYNQDTTNALNFSNDKEREQYMEELKKLGNRAPSRSSYFGIVDLCGFKKDRFYLYQAKWKPDVKMAHILPHWNWNDKTDETNDRTGKVTPVHVYTTGDEAELFLNGKSLGKREKGDRDDNAYRLVWDDVVYRPGKLEVVVTKEGQPWARQAIETTGKPTGFTAESDRKELTGDGRDLAYVTITVEDARGRMVPTACLPFFFKISGPGEIIGVCNGDPTDFNNEPGADKGPFQSPQVKSFNGLAQVIVRAKRGESGTVVLESTTEGMKSVKTTLKVVEATDEQLKQ